MKRLAAIWRHNRLLVLAFLVALSLAVFFGLGALRHAHDFKTIPDQTIQGWMTPRYVSHSWDLPRDTMIETLDLQPESGRFTLEELAEDRGIPVAVLIERIEAAITRHRAAHH